MEKNQTDVAVFMDFENIYISVRNKYDVNPNFESIMDRATEHGRVTIARAYADWYRYPKVTNALYANSIEPVYVPTYYYDREEGRTGKAIKNSVDIHLCIDMMQTLYNYPTIQNYVLVTGDRDFIPLVNAVRQHGKRVLVVGVAGAASSHLAQSADEFVFYRQLMDMQAEPEEVEAEDVYDALVEAVHLARERGITCTLASLKLLMVEILGDFDETEYEDPQGRSFSKFKDFVKEAERRDLVQIFTSGTVNEVFLPDEDPYELSQFAPTRSITEDTDDEFATEEFGTDDWDVFLDTMRQFDDPVLFIQIYDALRGLRNKEVLDMSNKQIRRMIKHAINEDVLVRETKGNHAYYHLTRKYARGSR